MDRTIHSLGSVEYKDMLDQMRRCLDGAAAAQEAMDIEGFWRHLTEYRQLRYAALLARARLAPQN